MLKTQRIDGFLIDEKNGTQVGPAYENLFSSREIAKCQIFLAVYRRYAANVPALDKAIQEMQKSGFLTRTLGPSAP